MSFIHPTHFVGAYKLFSDPLHMYFFFFECTQATKDKRKKVLPLKLTESLQWMTCGFKHPEGHLLLPPPPPPPYPPSRRGPLVCSTITRSPHSSLPFRSYTASSASRGSSNSTNPYLLEQTRPGSIQTFNGSACRFVNNGRTTCVPSNSDKGNKKKS